MENGSITSGRPLLKSGLDQVRTAFPGLLLCITIAAAAPVKDE